MKKKEARLLLRVLCLREALEDILDIPREWGSSKSIAMAALELDSRMAHKKAPVVGKENDDGGQVVGGD